MIKKVLTVACAAILIFSMSMKIAQAGVRVSPGAFCVQHVKLGEELKLIDMVITNESDQEKRFTMKVLKPSEAVDNWVKGYNEIPDTSWFYLAQDTVTISPYTETKIPLYIKIPKEEKYYNQHWMVYVEVTAEEEGALVFRAAVAPNYMIETQAKRDIGEIPYGTLAVSPTIVLADKVIPGKSKQVTFKLYNNDSVEHIYTLTSYIPQASIEKQDISVSAGYEFIKDSSWVKPVKHKIKLKPMEIKEIILSVRIPKGFEPMDKGWESIILIEPDRGLAGFVRVLVELR